MPSVVYRAPRTAAGKKGIKALMFPNLVEVAGTIAINAKSKGVKDISFPVLGKNVTMKVGGSQHDAIGPITIATASGPSP